jgi:hypothetical protein
MRADLLELPLDFAPALVVGAFQVRRLFGLYQA